MTYNISGMPTVTTGSGNKDTSFICILDYSLNHCYRLLTPLSGAMVLCWCRGVLPSFFPSRVCFWYWASSARCWRAQRRRHRSPSHAAATAAAIGNIYLISHFYMTRKISSSDTFKMNLNKYNWQVLKISKVLQNKSTS